uniref:Uncharacterized protein LOC111113752 n=1 Tax=Crassostrea virginica TaxID=6565 RepID=A0A8B8BWK1_CRAVI|nr:uncharacterized protein LOC111113752 [Crassostrea virginica]
MYAVVLLVCLSWVALLCFSVKAYENLALHQPAWQSSAILFYTADLAVDGRTPTCALSYLARTVEWSVDLGGVKNIHHVLIQYKSNSVYDTDYTKYFLGFSVYISNTTNKEDGVLCFRDTNYTRATIPNPGNISCPYHGKYVIYYNNRTHPQYPEWYSSKTSIALCEVEVYGCDVYTYGMDCKRCGNCSGSVQCDHVTGTCPNGCDPGMNGDECDRDFIKTHYTFDFAQCVSIPHHSRQVGPLFFETPRKIQIFGIRMEGSGSQYNYLIDEDQTIEKDGETAHGPNTIGSMLPTLCLNPPKATRL